MRFDARREEICWPDRSNCVYVWHRGTAFWRYVFTRVCVYACGPNSIEHGLELKRFASITWSHCQNSYDDNDDSNATKSGLCFVCNIWMYAYMRRWTVAWLGSEGGKHSHPLCRVLCHASAFYIHKIGREWVRVNPLNGRSLVRAGACADAQRTLPNESYWLENVAGLLSTHVGGFWSGTLQTSHVWYVSIV